MANCKTALQHNGAVYGAMDVQALAQRRVDADVPELRVLRETSALLAALDARVQWLLKHDGAENQDHEEIVTAGRDICRRLEGLKNEDPTGSNGRVR